MNALHRMLFGRSDNNIYDFGLGGNKEPAAEPAAEKNKKEKQKQEKIHNKKDSNTSSSTSLEAKKAQPKKASRVSHYIDEMNAEANAIKANAIKAKAIEAKEEENATLTNDKAKAQDVAAKNKKTPNTSSSLPLEAKKAQAEASHEIKAGTMSTDGKAQCVQPVQAKKKKKDIKKKKKKIQADTMLTDDGKAQRVPVSKKKNKQHFKNDLKRLRSKDIRSDGEESDEELSMEKKKQFRKAQAKRAQKRTRARIVERKRIMNETNANDRDEMRAGKALRLRAAKTASALELKELARIDAVKEDKKKKKKKKKREEDKKERKKNREEEKKKKRELADEAAYELMKNAKKTKIKAGIARVHASQAIDNIKAQEM